MFQYENRPQSVLPQFLNNSEERGSGIHPNLLEAGTAPVVASPGQSPVSAPISSDSAMALFGHYTEIQSDRKTSIPKDPNTEAVSPIDQDGICGDSPSIAKNNIASLPSEEHSKAHNPDIITNEEQQNDTHQKNEELHGEDACSEGSFMSDNRSDIPSSEACSSPGSAEAAHADPESNQCTVGDTPDQKQEIGEKVDTQESEAKPDTEQSTPPNGSVNWIEQISRAIGLQRLKDSDGVAGHGHADHGPQTTGAQQTQRVQTGKTPSGRNAKAGRSTRFHSSEAEADAISRARQHLKTTNPPKTRTDPRTGMPQPGEHVVVVGGKKGGYGSGAEVVRDANGKPLPGRPVRPTGSDPNAKVVFRTDAKGNWYEHTKYPTNEPMTAPKTPPTAMGRLGSLVNKGLGVLGTVGGVMQTYGGIKELGEGQTVDGVADVTGGAANTFSGVAGLMGRGILGTYGAGIAAVIDGGRDVYHGVREKNLERGLLGGTKSLGGTLMLTGAATGNPFLIGAGALTYGGALIYEHRKAIWNGMKKTTGAIGNGARRAWNWLKS